MSTPTPSNQDDVDIWRDTPLRFMGYANELGESFKPIAPRFVLPSYVISFGYCLGDTLDKSKKAHDDHHAEFGEPNKEPELSLSNMPTTVYHAAVDTLLWQSLASVFIPGFVINRVVKFSGAALNHPSIKQSVPRVAARWGPTVLGLGVIPFIVHPIDEAVHYAMDQTTRKFMNVQKKTSGD